MRVIEVDSMTFPRPDSLTLLVMAGGAESGVPTKRLPAIPQYRLERLCYWANARSYRNRISVPIRECITTQSFARAFP